MNRSLFLASVFLIPLVACGGDGGTTIAGIQGTGATSPLEDQTVSVEGVVTGDFQDNDTDDSGNLAGFFVQAESPDSDASTSDGVFVFDGHAPTIDVAVGDRVLVTGTVTEYFGETQIAASSVLVNGRGTIEATELSLPVSGVSTNSDGVIIANLERFEGMLLRLPQTLTLTGLYNLERFGEIRVSQGGRLFQYTNRNRPNVAGYASHIKASATRTMVLDDGRRDQNVMPVRYLDNSFAPGGVLRTGNSVTGLTGNLRFSRSSGSSGTETWRLMPTSDPEFVADNPRPGAPEIDGTLRVASFNADNFFSRINSGRRICGPNDNHACRGADSREELERQLEKITVALSMIDADIVGLIELENDESASLITIVESLNRAMGANTYTILNTGTIGDGTIKTGFIFKPATVTASGSHAILDSSVDADFDDGRNRPPLAQTFVQNSNGEKLTIVVNHLKSKGSNCDAASDPNTGDGQANCNRTRTSAANSIAAWLQSDPTASGDPDILIIGDLNADVQEDPLAAFADAGFANLVENSDSQDAYSFVFDAQSGALDHALVSATLAPQVVAATEWHISADEAPIHDYNLEHGRDPAIFDGTTPYRASDHDPVIIGLDLD